MSEYNAANNRAVWFDIPVADLDRSVGFYSSVLAIAVTKEQVGEVSFGLLEHKDGNGGCLVVQPNEIAAESGILLYMNVNGRIHDAVAKVGLVVVPEFLDDFFELGEVLAGVADLLA